ncbi:MAG: CBS domain-containing protein [Candidatus Polarisedimenticolaceae bacterium]|nr:CBS domain-containing protein [Candidatus Polarisedimenticolaceae bacterium]
MTFYVQGLSGHERMPLGEIFKEPVVEKTAATASTHAINEKKQHESLGKQGQQHSAAEAYQSIKQLPQAPVVLIAEQIMVSPVVTLEPQASVDEALALFRTRHIRHLPIVSSTGLLVGIVSERAILHHLSGVTENYQQQALHSRVEPVNQLMKSPVLTASRDTDVRYIARLFVEQRVGALPIVTDDKLTGIITRSDVLSAVMRHFVLELWA